MINETRDSFDSWVMETYNRLHESLFTGRKFNMRYLLSGDMLAYLLVKPWYRRVMNLEDIRGSIAADCVKDIREYLELPNMDNQVTLFSWFVPPRDKEVSEIEQAILTPVIAYGLGERIRFLRQKGYDYTLEDAFSWFSRNEDAIEDCYYHVMDMIERFNEEGRDIPEDLRAVVRFLEPNS